MPQTYSINPKLNSKIKKNLKEFKGVWKSNEKVFEELCFCILTPQSSARQAMKAIDLLKKNNFLEKGTAKRKRSL